MGYLHIENLYKNQTILQFKECYAMEKIHGTSAHISFKNRKLSLFSGGIKSNNFEQLFNKEKLITKFVEKHLNNVCIFGEAYGGKCQGMSETYGKELKFVCFDVKMNDEWLCVPHAELFTKSFGLDFVHYKKISCELEYIDTERDADSIQAVRNGCGKGKMREGIVLRTINEFRDKRGIRILAKHKRQEFRETKKIRTVVNKADMEILEKANDIALEWVTEQRLNHVIDKVCASNKPCIQDMPNIIRGMLEDVLRESKDEIIDSKSARKAISNRTCKIFKIYLNTINH